MSKPHKTTRPPHYDPEIFSTDSYVRRVEKPWGYELHWVPAGLMYMGKIIHINKGARLSLQLHDTKQESWLLMSGRAAAMWENSNGEFEETDLLPGVGYTTKVGQRHRLVGLTDCDIVEVSTPELGTTWRIEDDYDRPNETPEQRAHERGEKKSGGKKNSDADKKSDSDKPATKSKPDPKK